MAKLTVADLRILRFPPTPQTWICGSKKRGNDGVTIRVCEFTNSGLRDRCSLCASKKPRHPKLLWTQYVKVAVKAGIPPEDFGKPWSPKLIADADQPTAPVKRSRKRGSTS